MLPAVSKLPNSAMIQFMAVPTDEMGCTNAAISRGLKLILGNKQVLKSHNVGICLINVYRKV
jgi:hypothetical protein